VPPIFKQNLHTNRPNKIKKIIPETDLKSPLLSIKLFSKVEVKGVKVEFKKVKKRGSSTK